MPVLEDSSVQAVACAFLESRHANDTIVTTRSQAYEWDTKEVRWKPLSYMDLQRAIRRWMLDAQLVKMVKGTPVTEPINATNGMISSVTETVLAITDMGWGENQCMPAWIGDGACPVDRLHTIAFEDVLVDISATAALRKVGGTGYVTQPRDRRWLDVTVVPARFEDGRMGEAPVFDATLEQWSNGDEAWKELYLRRWGYLMMATREYQRMFFMYGVPRGGKGVTVHMDGVLLRGNTFPTNLKGLAGPHGTEGVEGKRSVVVNEVGDMNPLDAGMAGNICKEINGGDSIRINPKNLRTYKAVIPAVVTLVGNDLPPIQDAKDSFWSKVLLLPFKSSFLGCENFRLVQDLEQEVRAIAMRAVEAAIRLELAGPGEKWPQPEGVTEIKRTLRRINDCVAAFVEEACRFPKQRNLFVRKEELYRHYVEWCEDRNVTAKARNAFFRLLNGVSTPFPIKSARRGAGGAESVIEGLLIQDWRHPEVAS